MKTKVCSKCGINRPLDGFYERRNICIICINVAAKTYRDSHRSYYSSYNKRYKVTHREEINRATRKRYKDDKKVRTLRSKKFLNTDKGINMKLRRSIAKKLQINVSDLINDIPQELIDAQRIVLLINQSVNKATGGGVFINVKNH